MRNIINRSQRTVNDYRIYMIEDDTGIFDAVKDSGSKWDLRCTDHLPVLCIRWLEYGHGDEYGRR